MSWSVSATNVTAGEIEALEVNADQQGGYAPDEVRSAFAAAKNAALELINSGALGDADDVSFHVTLAGHANEGHKPNGSWVNDHVSISISQAQPHAETATEAVEPAAVREEHDLDALDSSEQGDPEGQDY